MPSLLSVKKSAIFMGTSIAIIIIHEDVSYVRGIIEEVFGEFGRIEKIMSIYDSESEVSKLNENGFLDHASKELIYVLREAKKISTLTGGAYDVSILPLIEYAHKVYHNKNVVLNDELKRILELVDYSSIKIYGDRIKFSKKGMKIVLNSIAKGYAVDVACEKILRHGIRHALINAGGDIRAIGGKTVQEPWKVAIRDPFIKERHASILKIYDRAVATSGTYEEMITKDRIPHIVNPLSISNAHLVVSATVVTDRATVADALATGLCALDPIRGIELVERLGNAEAMIITRENNILKTSGFRNYEDC